MASEASTATTGLAGRRVGDTGVNTLDVSAELLLLPASAMMFVSTLKNAVEDTKYRLFAYTRSM